MGADKILIAKNIGGYKNKNNTNKKENYRNFSNLDFIFNLSKSSKEEILPYKNDLRFNKQF